MKKFVRWFRIVFFLLVTTYASAQDKTVEGTVIGTDGTPLPGANVIVKGTTRGVQTDANGKFVLQAAPSDILLITYIGFKNVEVPVGSQTTISATLEDDEGKLDELVVTALGITKEKKSLGYTVQEVKSSQLSEARENNLVNALAGKVAGVRITNSQGNMGSSRIVIRGETSISGNNQPLFVVDGLPVDNSQLTKSDASRDFPNAISDINTEDIESISVLKGPNAAALYGSRAANGVIIINTKKGRAGKRGLGISVTSGATFENLLVLPDYQNVYGQGAGGEFSYVDGKGKGKNDGIDESWGPKMDGRLIPQFYSNGEHEIGHTLGAPHEHQNPNAGIVWDEEAVYAALAAPPNNWSRETTFHNIIRKLPANEVEGSTHDPNSIMHYPFEAGLIKEPAAFRNGISPAGGLSAKDKEFVKKFYPPLVPADYTKLTVGKSAVLDIRPGEQKNFVFKPTVNRKYKISTFGALDTVMVLFERTGGEEVYIAGDDDSGTSLNAKIHMRLIKGREYIVRVRLFYSSSEGAGSVMVV